MHPADGYEKICVEKEGIFPKEMCDVHDLKHSGGY